MVRSITPFNFILTSSFACQMIAIKLEEIAEAAKSNSFIIHVIQVYCAIQEKL